MYTPNLNRLARSSLVLQRSYVSQAICSPSRTSVLTGRRPDTTRVWDLKHYWRIVGGNFTTIPQYFKENGYRTVGMGKIFHPGKRASGNNDPISWTDPYFLGKDDYPSNRLLWQAVTEAEERRTPLIDTQIADFAVKTLNDVAPKAKSGEQPFFVAVGFHKPHTPWNYPERFEKYYPLDSLQLPDNYFAPVGMPAFAWHNFSRLGTYKNVRPYNLHDVGSINYTFPKNLTLIMRRAYYSSISFTDYNVGRVVQELENLGLANDTIVSFWGDHGWQLGEHCEWQKETVFELAARAPMMVKVPGLTDNGIVTSQLVEFVDLFPTLVDLAGLPKMKLCPENSSQILLCTEGKSFVPLFKNPNITGWKKAAFSQFPHDKNGRNGLDVMGYSIRTDRYRYTEWATFKPHLRPEWDKLRGVELYDHGIDPEENRNRAQEPSYTNLRSQLSKQLRAGWRYVNI
ncbi:iduronate 2-sulfatase-like [Haliotis rubra]|uniref:iduronate 2-sulfatase-like n=1 Tax=Haliotis rubra TaxID=36100 RepID=UPI001EE607DC|nr:iduronate 2-sulfatase-like [Haliotis rubra]